MAVLELTQNTFDKTIQENDIIILDFWAPWCAPCTQFAPTYEQMSDKINDIIFAKINTEDEQELAAHFQIRSIPTLMIFREQIAIFSQSGAMAASDLQTIIDKAKNLDMDVVRTQAAKQEENQ